MQVSDLGLPDPSAVFGEGFRDGSPVAPVPGPPSDAAVPTARRARALLPRGFILSPSATLRVAGSAATIPLAFVRFSA